MWGVVVAGGSTPTVVGTMRQRQRGDGNVSRGQSPASSVATMVSGDLIIEDGGEHPPPVEDVPVIAGGTSDAYQTDDTIDLRYLSSSDEEMYSQDLGEYLSSSDSEYRVKKKKTCAPSGGPALCAMSSSPS